MPRRPTLCDRARVEAVLTPELRGALEALRELTNIRDWRLSPLEPVFTHAAVLLRTAELIGAGLAAHRAVDRASFELGVAPETSRTRGRRWPRESRSLCTPPARSGSGNVKTEPRPGGRP
jgi:hypothetical protein